MIFHCMNIPILFNHLSVDGHLGCFYFFIIVNNAALNTHVQVKVFFEAQNFFYYTFDKVQFIYFFSFVTCIFSVISKKLCLIQGHDNLL